MARATAQASSWGAERWRTSPRLMRLVRLRTATGARGRIPRASAEPHPSPSPLPAPGSPTPRDHDDVLGRVVRRRSGALRRRRRRGWRRRAARDRRSAEERVPCSSAHQWVPCMRLRRLASQARLAPKNVRSEPASASVTLCVCVRTSNPFGLKRLSAETRKQIVATPTIVPAFSCARARRRLTTLNVDDGGQHARQPAMARARSSHRELLRTGSCLPTQAAAWLNGSAVSGAPVACLNSKLALKTVHPECQ